jgi:hypothetical protein
MSGELLFCVDAAPREPRATFEILVFGRSAKEVAMANCWRHLVLGALLISSPALAQGAQTTNSYTPVQANQTRDAARAAGYQPSAITFAQGGNFFINATRNGQTFSLTVTPDGKVYASTPSGSLAGPA